MIAYYNEIEPYAAQWLRNLIAAGHIAPGEVDERSLLDVSPDDLTGFTQCHFFAGIGVWSYALRQGGWPDSRPVWTGSCPCQPFSVAGVGGGLDDERHLWPFWFHLIEQCRPSVVFGEQVEAAIRHGWLDLVQSDMEGIGYAFAATGIPAAGVGAPHIRQRLWFVADTANERQHGRGASQESNGRNTPRQQPERLCNACRLADAQGEREYGVIRDTKRESAEQIRKKQKRDEHVRDSESRGLADAGGKGLHACTQPGIHRHEEGAGARHGESERYRATGRLDNADEEGFGIASAHRLHQHAVSPTHGFWRNADWLLCRDGKWRPVEPGTFPLAHGAASRVGRLRAYGNAISPFPASEMIAAYLECRP